LKIIATIFLRRDEESELSVASLQVNSLG
jgi:hypothetical protein